MTVTVNDPVGITEIAERVGVRKNVVSNWTNRYDDFPDPVISLSLGRVWEWAPVETWALAHKKVRFVDVLKNWRRAIDVDGGLNRLTDEQRTRVLQLFFRDSLTGEEIAELDRLWRIVEGKEGTQ